MQRLLLIIGLATLLTSPFANAQMDVSKFIFKPQKKETNLQKFFKSSYAIIIAVGNYNKLPSLRSPKQDAIKMKGFLLQSGEYDEVAVLLDADATYERIRHFMGTYFPEKMATEGRYRFLFYFSGHGSQHLGYANTILGFLQLQAALGKPTDGETIDMDEIERWAQRYRYTNHMLFLLDCCFSGLAGVEVKEGYNDRVNPLDLAKEDGRHMITAGGSNEKSIGDLKAWGGSLFTDVIIKGMSGKADKNNDGVVTIHELFDHTQTVVRNEAKRKGYDQNPSFSNLGNNKGQYFFVYKEPRPLGTYPQIADTQKIENKALDTTSTALPADSPVIRNYIRVKGILKEDTPIYIEPSKSSLQVDRAKQFSLVFLFNPESGRDYIKNGFYHVGKEPDQPLGWIPRVNLQEWNHRLALHFSPLIGRQPALIYGTQRDAEAEIRSNAPPDRSKAIAEEPGDISANRYNMLLPVLEPLTINTNNQIRKAYQIGFLTGEKNKKPSIQAPASGHETSGAETALLEIMFVLDATKNMQPFIDATATAISRISQRVLSMREAGTRIGLTCYRDYIQNQSSMEYVTKNFSPLTSDHRQVINILKNEVREAPVFSEDVPEAMFDGLYAAITETNWDKEKSSLRVIVLIGNASGHPEGHEKNPLNYSLQQIRQTASDNRVRILAIKIKSESEEDNMIHREQLQKLATGLTPGDEGFFTEVEVSSNMIEEYAPGVVVATVETEIARMGRLVSVSKAPNPVKAAQQLPSATDRVIILKDLKPRKTYDPEVEFSEGWVSERDYEGYVQVKPYVFMAYDDLALIIFYLSTAHTLATSPTYRVFQAISDLMQTQTGEMWKDDQTLETHYALRLRLPVNSELLKFTPMEIAQWGEQQRTDFAEVIKRKIKLCETHRDDPANWYKLGQRDFRYTFVPLEFLP